MTPRDQFLSYFREHYPELIKLARAMKEDELKFLKPYFGDDEEGLDKATDEYWVGIAESERTKIWNFCNCLDD